MLFKQWMFSLVLLFSFSAYSDESIEFFEEGLRANEALIDFIHTRQCELGLVANCQKPLSARDIQILKQNFRDLADWKERAFQETIPENDWVRGMKFTIKGGPHEIFTEERLNPLTLKREKVLRATLNQDSLPSLKKLSLAASLSLVMYDNFIRLSQLFTKAKKFRSIVANDMGADGKLFFETFSTALEEKYWKRTEALVKFLEAGTKYAGSNQSIFDQYITSSFTAIAMRNDDLFYKLRGFFFIQQSLNQSEFFNRIDLIGGKLSKIFGNTIGKVQFREGKLKKFAKDPAMMASLKRKLAPLDILFEKTPFRLTDKFIPGHYGHVAIWLGSPEEITNFKVNYQGNKIPLLDHPDVLPHLEKLSQGKLIIEALREPGVTMNTLEHFMDIDDFLVIKPLNVSDPGEYLLRTIQQVGKPYDFNFDVETESSLVCSELIYQVFNEEEWPTAMDLGRYTISPDHVAWKAIDSCYSPEVMYHDGIEIKENLKGTLKRILESANGIRYTPVGNCL